MIPTHDYPEPMTAYENILYRNRLMDYLSCKEGKSLKVSDVIKIEREINRLNNLIDEKVRLERMRPIYSPITEQQRWEVEYKRRQQL